MSRPPRGSALTDPSVRRILARLCYAAAAHAAGGYWGSTCLEARLGFRPASRAKRNCSIAPGGGKVKRVAPTGSCKHWLKGRHLPQDQTLKLIAETLPKAAESIRSWRDGPLGSALTVKPGEPRVAGKLFAIVSRELWADYVAWLALGPANPGLQRRLLTTLTQEALRGGELPLFYGVLALDRQFDHSKATRAEAQLNKLRSILMDKAARQYPEIAFIKEDLDDSRRSWINAPERDAAEAESVGALRDDAFWHLFNLPRLRERSLAA